MYMHAAVHYERFQERRSKEAFAALWCAYDVNCVVILMILYVLIRGTAQSVSYKTVYLTKGLLHGMYRTLTLNLSTSSTR